MAVKNNIAPIKYNNSVFCLMLNASTDYALQRQYTVIIFISIEINLTSS